MNRAASISGDASRRARSVARNARRQATSVASRTFRATYASTESATSSGSPTVSRMLDAPREMPRSPRQGHKRNTHPQRIERGRPAVVGKRVERNVDLADRRVVIADAQPSAPLDPVGGDAAARESLGQPSLHVRRRPTSSNTTSRIGQRSQHAAPELEALRGDLSHLIERAEHDGSARDVIAGRAKRHLRPGRVAPLTVRQSMEALGVEVLGRARWIGVAIADPVVHRGEAGRAEIAEPRRLYGRGMATERASRFRLVCPDRSTRMSTPSFRTASANSRSRKRCVDSASDPHEHATSERPDCRPARSNRR